MKTPMNLYRWRSVRPNIEFVYSQVDKRLKDNDDRPIPSRFETLDKCTDETVDHPTVKKKRKSIPELTYPNNYIKKNNNVKITQEKNVLLPQINGEVLFGIHPIWMALKAKRREFYKLYCKSIHDPNSKISEIIEQCESLEIPIQYVSKRTIINLAPSGSVHQGICLDASPLEIPLIGDEINIIKQGDSVEKNCQLALYLDQVQDPMNLGAIFRSSHFFGISSIYLGYKSCCPVTNVVVKASSGAAEFIPIHQVTNPKHFITCFRHSNWNVVGAMPPSWNKAVSVSNHKITKNTILIIGNEGLGISSELLRLCHEFVTISALNPSQSLELPLNASAATAILLHTLSTNNFLNAPPFEQR